MSVQSSGTVKSCKINVGGKVERLKLVRDSFVVTFLNGTWHKKFESGTGIKNTINKRREAVYYLELYMCGSSTAVLYWYRRF